jgi:hypothetical protein
MTATTENEPSVQDEISSLYAAAAAVERGQTTSDAAEWTPVGSEGAEDEEAAKAASTQETDSETETVDQDETTQDPSEGQETPEAEASKELSDGQSETEDQDPPKSKRQQRKDEALTKSWDNANRRHQEADQRERQLAQQFQQLQQVEAKLKQAIPNDPLPKYSVEEIGQTLSEVMEEGDLDTAKNLATALANKAKAMVAVGAAGLDNPQLAEAWEQSRQQVVRDNPELSDQKSPLFVKATEYLSGPWKELLTAHPSGVGAAVEVAKLAIAAESVSELETKVKQLEAENDKLRKATAVEATTPTSRGTQTNPKKKLSVEDEIAELYKAAAAGGA